MSKSWNPQVIADDSGKWVGNGLFFATEQEAKNYADDLGWRWTAVINTRAHPSEEPVNYTYTDRKLRPVVSSDGK